MKKIGLFGGSFDPVHNGHTEMARRLEKALELDEILWMPGFVPPHKLRDRMASAADRLAMCRLAVQDDPLSTVSTLEIDRGGASFTADTLQTLSEQYPDVRWYLITGADMFCTLRTWYHFDAIARKAVLCTVAREGVDTAELKEYACLLESLGAECYVDETPVQTVSSTEIRQRVNAGKPLTDLVPGAVADYIVEHGLYRKDDTMETMSRDEQFKAIIRTRLGDYRYRHSLCVAQEAKQLAKQYGGDEEKAYTAGLLHDIMKDTDKNAQLQIMEDSAIVLDNVEKAVPKLWHARSGEAFVRRILHLEDEEILSAIRYHTTGRAGMSLLEKILFTADFTSADRDYPDVDVMRKKSRVSLEDAMLYGIAFTINDLLAQGQPVHPDTLAAYNELILETMRKDEKS